MIEIVTQKKNCATCKKEYSLDDFYKRKEGVLKRHSSCVFCCREKDLNKNYKAVVDLDGEYWRDIPGFISIYQASNLGRIKSVSRIITNKRGISKRTRDIILKPTIDKGYLAVGVYSNDKVLRTGVHRLVASAFIPNLHNKPCVNHINGVKDDNKVTNLEWVTYSENEQHSIKVLKKKYPNGENASSAILTERDVLIIRRLHKINPKYDRKKVALKFGMHPNSLNDIHRRKSWKHI